MRKILIVGATSTIAEATARIWAQQGDYLFLVARDQQRLQIMADDLKVRGGAKVEIFTMDANDFDALARLGHTLKGTCKSYGFLDLSDLGKQLEELAKSEAPQSQFTQWIEVYERQVNRYLSHLRNETKGKRQIPEEKS